MAMRTDILLFVFLACCANIGQLRAVYPKVCFNRSSCVLGKFMPGNETYRFEAYLGIPYAKPPIGKLRFSDPVEVSPCNSTLIARSPKPECIQKNYISPSAPILGSEDCLYLNVYRPQSRSSEKLPVLFYIHGGGFFSGSPSPLIEGPEYFMDTNEVILVAPAYRLGLFGFLSTNDTEMTGNYALKDQNLALKWVNKYISAFGGDPDRVTMLGHSAGAASVHFQMLSPASEGLFQNAILMSGVANPPYAAPLADPKAQVIQLAKAAGIANAENLSTAALVTSLRKKTKVKLLLAADKLKSPLGFPLVTFRPNIEQPNWPNAFATNDVFQYLAGNLNCVSTRVTAPWIIGNVPSKGEGLVIALRLASNATLQGEFNQNFKKSLSDILDLPYPEIADVRIDRIVSNYMDGVYELNDKTLDGFLQLLGDAHFIYPSFKAIETDLSSTSDQVCGSIPVRQIQLAGGSSSLETTSAKPSTKAPGIPSNNLVGIIKFDYNGPYSFSSRYSGSLENFSTVHGDDALFLFRSPLAFPTSYPGLSPEAALVKRYVDLYVNFAKTGKAEEFDEIEACTSEALNEGACQYLSIQKLQDPFQVDSNWDIEKMELWADIYY